MLINNISVNILDVIHYEEINPSVTHVSSRSNSSLALAINSYDEFITDGKKFHACSGSIAMIPGGTEYTRISGNENVIVFHFEILGGDKACIEVFKPCNTDKYLSLFSEALSIWEEKKAGFKYKVTSIFYMILSLLQSDNDTTEKRQSKKSAEVAENAKNIMDLHFSDAKLNIAELAKRLSVSETYIRRIFSQQYGISPKKYLDDVRMNHACSLINSGICQSKEIARLCGFSDVKYFRAFFKSKAGVSPSDYKYTSE